MIHPPLSVTATAEEIVEYFKSFSRTLQETYRDGEYPSLGESDGAVVNPQFAETHDIYEQVRVTRSEAGYEWHACPRSIGSATPYSVTPSKVSGAMDEYNAGRSSDYGRPYAAQFPSIQTQKDSFNRLEKSMFASLLEEYNIIVLVDPSTGSLWRAVDWPGRFVVRTTRDFDDRGVNEFIRNHRELSFYRADRHRNCIQYLGSNGRTQAEGEWFSLVVEPSWAPGLMGTITQSGYGDSFVYGYDRKGRRYEVRPTLAPYVTGSTLLCAKYGTPKTPIMLFSSFIRFVEPQSARIEIGFLEEFPDYEDGVSRRGRVVYDVQGEGSWYNRRMKTEEYVRNHGLEMAQILKVGKFSVSLEGPSPLPLIVAKKIEEDLHFEIDSQTNATTYFFSDEYRSVRRVLDTDIPGGQDHIHVMGLHIDGPLLPNGLRYRCAKICGDRFGLLASEWGNVYVSREKQRLSIMFTMTPIPKFLPDYPGTRYVSPKTASAISEPGNQLIVTRSDSEDYEATGYHVLAYLDDDSVASIKAWERYESFGSSLWALDTRLITTSFGMTVDSYVKTLIHHKGRFSHKLTEAYYNEIRRYLYGLRVGFVGHKENDGVRLLYYDPVHLKYMRSEDLYVQEPRVHFVEPTVI